MYEFSLPRQATAAEAAATVEEFGVAHIEAFLRPPQLDRLATECETILDDRADWVNPEGYSKGKAVRLVRKEIDRTRYPTLLEVHENPFLEDVVHAYYGDQYVFCEKIYSILDVVGSATIVQQPHYDKIQHFKIFFYLSDVGAGEGPFHCVPRSHSVARALQAENRERGYIPTDQEARVLPEDLVRQELPVLGGRGTLILFDSDILHRAGIPTAGSRLATRSLSFGPQSLGERL